jgi:hypothetical protein
VSNLPAKAVPSLTSRVPEGSPPRSAKTGAGKFSLGSVSVIGSALVCNDPAYRACGLARCVKSAGGRAGEQRWTDRSSLFRVCAVGTSAALRRRGWGLPGGRWGRAGRTRSVEGTVGKGDGSKKGGSCRVGRPRCRRGTGQPAWPDVTTAWCQASLGYRRIPL